MIIQTTNIYGGVDVIYVSRRSSQNLKNKLLGAYGNRVANSSFASFLEHFDQAEFNSIPATGVYIILTTGSELFDQPSTTKYLVWNIRKSNLRYNSTEGTLEINRGTPDGSLGFDPIFKTADFDSTFNKFFVTTVDPITGSNLSDRYTLSTARRISGFGDYTLEVFNFIVWLKGGIFVLSIPASQTVTRFPLNGRVFDRVIIKKGTEKRLTFDYDRLLAEAVTNTSSLYDATKHQYRYSFALSELEELIKDGDTSFNDFNIEFEIGRTTGQDIWRANSLRPGAVLSPTVDFNIVEEGLRTYVRLNGQFPFKEDDELIFSHIVPQELIDAGAGGTPEEQTANVQIAALRQQLATLSGKVTMNENDIDALERATGDVQEQIYWGVVDLTPKNSANKAISTSASSLAPLARAEFNLPATRSGKQITSLLTSGAFINFTAGASDGYYNPWVAVKTGSYTNLIFKSTQEERNLWGSAGVVTLGSESYTIFVRLRPITETKSLRIFIKDYQ